tara:strand:- start:878 stop:1078 length:201 start_codon:yes stop_codon:yes gene_type:complete
MANIKILPEIEIIHNDWCRANGYPVRSYKPQAGRPKFTSAKLQAASNKRQAPSSKHQASSRKLQAP